jgi:acyl carrier protein
MNTIEQQIKKIVSEQLGVPVDKIENHHAFIQDLGGDSLDTVEMVLTLEDQFNIEIQEEEAEEMSTVQRAISYVTKRLEQTA